MLEKTLVDSAIPALEFACNLNQCKGACCTMRGYRGAPLLDGELEEIEKAYPVVRKYLSYHHRDTIDERGLFQGRPGDYTTQVIDRQACAFVTFDGGIAKCAFEKAYLNDEIAWRKPMSCHLFPIRVDQGTPPRLRYEQIIQCQSALERGAGEGVKLSEFLKPALTRAFGTEWYDEFLEYCRQREAGNGDGKVVLTYD